MSQHFFRFPFYSNNSKKVFNITNLATNGGKICVYVKISAYVYNIYDCMHITHV